MSIAGVLLRLQANAAPLLQRTPRRIHRPTIIARIAPSSHRLASARQDGPQPSILDPPSRVLEIPASRRAPRRTVLLHRTDGIAPPVIEGPIDVPGSEKHKPMLCYAQIISTPTADTPGACVLLHYDSRRYVFGQMSEGTQRLMNQRKIGLSKLDTLFLSGPTTWANVGGLLGLVLTIADVIALKDVPDNNKKKQKKKADQGLSMVPSLKIRGAENLMHMLATARKFVYRKGLPLRVYEVEHIANLDQSQKRAPDYQDANIMVWYLSLKPEGQGKPHGRKRSHDDMVAEDSGEPTLGQDTGPPRRDPDVARAVVDNMFDSDWELDALVETTLHKVDHQAQIFVKGDDGQFQKYTGPIPDGKASVPDIPVFTRTPWPAVNISKLPRTTPSTQSVSYIVKNQPRRGRFKVEEAIRLGVDKPDYKRLTAGETVKGKDGIDVTPEMCVEATIEGRAFAFIDLPDVSYVEHLLARPEWSDESIVGTMDIIYWSLGPGVVHNPRIQDFMKQHGAIKHTVCSPDTSPNVIALESAAGSTTRAHMIDPDRFSLPAFSNEAETKLPENAEVARSGAKFQFAPRVAFQEEDVVPLFHIGAATSSDRDIQRLAKVARAKLSDPAFVRSIEAFEQDIPHRDLEVIPLGTGSALPSKYRNVSSTLVRIPGYGSYIFDCGENTVGQLRRMYGFAGAREVLRDLKLIWISHLHADHHLGTVSVIKAWRDATAPAADSSAQATRPPRLGVASHVTMLDWLREYSDIEDYGLDRLELIEIRGPQQRESTQNPFVLNGGLSRELGHLERIDAVRVEHCYGALACVMRWRSGLRIAYSGDCRPSSAFVQAGMDCHLLIHEATLDDELRADAWAKKHCTTSDALDIARRMRARRVMLTHFSQRYPKFAHASNNRGADTVRDQVVLVAFDQMRVRLGDFKKAALFLPALRGMFQEVTKDDDD